MCTNLKYIDFVVWTQKGLFIERIYPDVDFWNQNVPKSKEFFVRGILPELIGKWYSRPMVSATQKTIAGDISAESTSGNQHDRLEMQICYCRGGEHGQMVGCDNEHCPYEWFHLDCLELKALPKSKTWYCPECQKHRSCKSTRGQRADYNCLQ